MRKWGSQSTMRKDIITHFSFMLAFFVIIAFLRKWFALEYLPFLYGGIIGTIIPDADYFIYVYLLRPEDQNSESANQLFSDKKYKQAWSLLTSSQTLAADLIFHSAYFQLLFLVFAFLVVTSSNNLLGRGLVLGFLLHLLVDQFMDLFEAKNLDRWFRKFIVIQDGQQRNWYLIGNLIVLIVLGLVF